MGQNFVGQDVTGAISLGQNVVGQEVSGAGRRGQNFVGQDVTGAISLGQEVSGAGGSGAGSRESNFNQSGARKHCFIASDWSKFETLPRKYRTLLY